jgi:hypothetical protein
LDLIERIVNLTRGAVQRLQVRSAMNPILWLVAITTPTGLGAVMLFRGDWILCIASLLVVVIPVLVACAIFIYFAMKQPDKLQSEEYQVTRQTLEIVQQKVEHLTIDPASLERLADLRRREIGSGADGTK